MGSSVHALHHAETHAESGAIDGSCHIEAAHTAEAPVLASDEAAVHVPDCTLCATRVLGATIDLPPVPAPHARLVSRLAPSSGVFSAEPIALLGIRGPPRAA